MKYGEFKQIYRKNISNGEITYLRVNQAAGKIMIGSTEHFIYVMEIKSLITL